MKRRLSGEIKVIGYYPVVGMQVLYVLPPEYVEYWEEKKGNYVIALCWQGKLHFRQLYIRKDKYCFKFFNHVIYLSEVERTEGTYLYINI
nr:MAG TPA: hypothetical protein [Bacteriophage sp.]